jgi:tRNA(fMet)-specific endonuclease VapC
MRRYVLDTNILVHYVRASELYKKIETAEALSQPDCMPLISVVTEAEILSFSIQKNWGQNKLKNLKSLLSKLIIIDINSNDSDLLTAYAEIDAYSKGKLHGNSLGTSAIKMGKNDIWIAATAKVANATLLTTDGDFDHLHGKFAQVKKY